MDLFYRMGKNNGYRTDGRGNRLACTNIKIKLDGDDITAWNNIVAKRKAWLYSDARQQDDMSDVDRFVGFGGERVTIGVYISENETLVFMQDNCGAPLASINGVLPPRSVCSQLAYDGRTAKGTRGKLVSHGHSLYDEAAMLDTLAHEAESTILRDEEIVTECILSALDDAKGSMSAPQMIICDMAELMLKDIRRRKQKVLGTAAEFKRTAMFVREEADAYIRAGEKQINPHLPIWILFGVVFIGFLMFCSVATGDSTFVMPLIWMCILFVPIAPIVLVISSCMAQHNKKVRHKYGIKDMELDRNDNITSAAYMGGALYTGWHIAKSPGRLMKHMTTHSFKIR